MPKLNLDDAKLQNYSFFGWLNIYEKNFSATSFYNEQVIFMTSLQPALLLMGNRFQFLVPICAQPIVLCEGVYLLI